MTLGMNPLVLTSHSVIPVEKGVCLEQHLLSGEIISNT